jgi:hypothetical protein
MTDQISQLPSIDYKTQKSGCCKMCAKGHSCNLSFVQPEFPLFQGFQYMVIPFCSLKIDQVILENVLLKGF